MLTLPGEGRRETVCRWLTAVLNVPSFWLPSEITVKLTTSFSSMPSGTAAVAAKFRPRVRLTGLLFNAA